MTRPMKEDASHASASDFRITDEPIGTDLGSITDPEFFCRDGIFEMTFLQDKTVYVAKMDPTSGQIIGGKDDFATLTNQDVQAVEWARSGAQGPEFGYDDEHGRSVIFTALVDQKAQVACCFSGAESGWSAPRILTDAPAGRMGATPSRRGKKTTLVNYTQWGGTKERVGSIDNPLDIITNRQFYFVNAGGERHSEGSVPGQSLFHTQPPQWLSPPENKPDAPCDLMFTSYENGIEQIVRYNILTRERHLLTNDGDHKWDPDTFRDLLPDIDENPDPGDKDMVRLYVVSLAGDEPEWPDSILRFPHSLAVYKERNPSDPYAPLKRVLTIPISSDVFGDYNTIRSVEPFVFDGKGYVVARLVKPIPDENPLNYPCSIWVLGIHDGLRQQVSNHGTRQMDSEVMVGEDNVFVYYSSYTIDGPGLFGTLHLCATPLTRG